jgi:hypothetical protein
MSSNFSRATFDTLVVASMLTVLAGLSPAQAQDKNN